MALVLFTGQSTWPSERRKDFTERFFTAPAPAAPGEGRDSRRSIFVP